MNKPEWLVEIIEREEKATPGPWDWFGETKMKTMRLATVGRGRIYIMDFKRWGLQNAQPRFQIKGLMIESSEMVQYEVLGYQRVNEENRQNLYRQDFQGLDHPDAEFIAHSRQDVSTLLSALNKAYEVIERTREIIVSGAEGAICDTVWESSCGTLVDYLDNFLLSNPDQMKLEFNPTQEVTR